MCVCSTLDASSSVFSSVYFHRTKQLRRVALWMQGCKLHSNMRHVAAAAAVTAAVASLWATAAVAQARIACGTQTRQSYSCTRHIPVTYPPHRPPPRPPPRPLTRAHVLPLTSQCVCTAVGILPSVAVTDTTGISRTRHFPRRIRAAVW